jgi:hypothetical protein
MYKKLILTILLIPFLQSCSQNSQGGYTPGVKGSSVWNKYAPKSDVNNYYGNMQVYELCLEWEDNWHSKSARKNIARILQEKGEDPLRCHNPSGDEMKRTQSKLDALTTGLRNKCIWSGGSWNGSACL